MINIVYSANDKFFNQIFLSVLSILKHTKEDLNIFILTLDCTGKRNKKYYRVTDSQADLLRNLVKEKNINSNVTLINIEDTYNDVMKNNKNRKSAYTPYSLLRLLLPKLNLNINKLLYLDTDTMFLQDINKLYSIDITDYDFAAVQDAVGHYLFGKDYINTGVMLLNLDSIKKNQTFDKALNFLEKRFALMPDQDAINKSTKKKLLIDRRFNEQKKIKEDTVIKHFCNQTKCFPIIRFYKYKQTDIKDVHNVYHIYCFDDLYEIYLDYMDKYPNELKR